MKEAVAWMKLAFTFEVHKNVWT